MIQFLQIHSARRFYENIVPTFTVFDVECPDHSFRKFTDDGKYLVSFSRNQQDVIVYRPAWLSFSCKGEDCNTLDLPPKAKKFESFFTQLYSVPLASSSDVICKDFFLYLECNQFGLFATSTTQIHDAPAIGGAIQGVPSIEKITFHLLRLDDGSILDERVFHNDYVNLPHNSGVFLYDDLLAIVSLRYQRIHILQIRDSGNLVDIREIGEFCREDDELFLNSNAQASTTVSISNESWRSVGILLLIPAFMFHTLLHKSKICLKLLPWRKVAGKLMVVGISDTFVFSDSFLLGSFKGCSTKKWKSNVWDLEIRAEAFVAMMFPSPEVVHFNPILNRLYDRELECMSISDRSKLQQIPVDNVGNGVHNNQPIQEIFFLRGLKQRLLSFIFRGLWNEETDETQNQGHIARRRHSGYRMLPCSVVATSIVQGAGKESHGPIKKEATLGRGVTTIGVVAGACNAKTALRARNEETSLECGCGMGAKSGTGTATSTGRVACDACGRGRGLSMVRSDDSVDGDGRRGVVFGGRRISTRGVEVGASQVGKKRPRITEDQRNQCLKKKFYFHFQDYVDLIIWKVQFLDRYHLLIKFGSVDGGVSRTADNHAAFFAVYNMETTEIIAFYQFVKKMLASLPFSCQSQSPSPYFDQSLFRFDEK
ncbi:hypothetical protein RJ639_005554, partial [Escallonia herrerae]